jgi:hypothetical protein
LKIKHGIILQEPPPSKAQSARQQDLRQVITQAKQQQNLQKDREAQDTLQAAANPVAIHQALLRLIVHHDLPLNAIEWPELHTLVYTINHTASNRIWKSH